MHCAKLDKSPNLVTPGFPLTGWATSAFPAFFKICHLSTCYSHLQLSGYQSVCVSLSLTTFKGVCNKAAMANKKGNPLMPMFKVLLVGQMGVGKTSLIGRYWKREYPIAEPQSTIGFHFVTKVLDVDGKLIKLQIWDLAGQERFRERIVKSIYHNVHAVLFVYDMTEKKTLDEIENWFQECEVNGVDLDTIPVVLIGNKCDCVDKIAVSRNTAREFAESHYMAFFETSAKLDSEQAHIDEIFLTVGRILKFSKRMLLAKDTVSLSDKSEEGNCCLWSWVPFSNQNVLILLLHLLKSYFISFRKGYELLGKLINAFVIRY